MVSKERKAELERRNSEWVAAYRAGEFSTQIALRCGVSAAHVADVIRKAGVSISPEERNRRLALYDKHNEGRRRTGEKNTRPLRERFFGKAVVPDNPDDCWGWSGAFSGSGYPQIRMGGKTGFATHASLILDGRPRPKKMRALHMCDNPPCTNPRHLWWGTQRENILDAKSKGRLDLSGLSLGVAARLAKK